jgi:hypothetical protein
MSFRPSLEVLEARESPCALAPHLPPVPVPHPAAHDLAHVAVTEAHVAHVEHVVAHLEVGAVVLLGVAAHHGHP